MRLTRAAVLVSEPRLRHRVPRGRCRCDAPDVRQYLPELPCAADCSGVAPGYSNAILDMAALGFTGHGCAAASTNWGTMLSDVLQFAQSAQWVVTFPGLAILLTVLAFNLMGDGLRDA